MAMVNSTEADVIDTLAHLFEERLGGMMLVRLGLTELVEHFKQEEHALAKSLKTILQLRDEERKAYRAQLDSAAAYARQLEAQLQEARHIAARRFEDAMAPLPPGAAVGALPPPAEAGLPSVGDLAARLTHADDAAARAAAGRATALSLYRGVEPPPVTPVAQPPAPVQVPAASMPAKAEPPRPTAEAAAPEPPPPPPESNLARVLQLQERLARERARVPPMLGAAVPPLAPPPSKRHVSAASEAAIAPADPFETFERGELREAREAPSPARRAANPEIFTKDGEPFVFRHEDS